MKPQVSTTPGKVRFSSDQGIAWIVIDNPRKHNAMSIAMWGELTAALTASEQDPAVRCVVLRGEGDKAFCAGADVAEKQGVDAAQGLADLQVALAGLKAIKAFGKPLIAMVSGYCLGGGLAIALGCDMRIASVNSSFGIPAAKLGLAYQYGELKRLTDLVGPSRAKQIIFTADRVAAQRAYEWGLVNEVVAAEELQAFVSAMAGRIAANAPLTIAAAKQAVGTATVDADAQAIAACDERARACLASEDYAEGRLAFREKRVPVFKGR